MSKAIAPRKPSAAETALPIKRLTATVNVDGRPLQIVTEWWDFEPADVRSWQDDEPGVWLASRIYDPHSQESYYPARRQH